MDRQKTNPVSVMDILDIARRRKFHAIIPALLVILAVSAYVYTAPSKFRAKTLIAVGSGTETANSSVDPAAKVQSQLRTVREVLFEGPLFQTVIQQFNLLSTVPAGTDAARSLDTLKSRVSIEIDGEDAFFIGYEGTDRQQTADVVNRIAELFVAQTSARHELQTSRQTQVTDSGIDRLRQKLADLDSRIETYKQSAVEELPERADANLKQMEALQAQIQDKSTTLASEDARRAGVVSEMAEIEKKGMLNPPAEVAPKSANQLKLEAARHELDILKSRYTPKHPEYMQKEAEVRDLERLVTGEPRPPAAARAVSPAELRYTQLKADLDAIDRHMLNVRQERTALSNQMAGYRQHVNATPRHEQALAQMTREYEITKSEYEAQLLKQTDTHREEQLQKVATNGLAFRIVEPARVPLDPVSPHRLRLLALGLLAGIALGVATAFLAENVDSSFRDVDEFQTQTGLTVLSIIPRLKKLSVSKRLSTSSNSLSLQHAGAGYQPATTIVTILDPQSVASEQFQILAMRLRNSAKTLKCPVLLVTSSSGGEGKTVSSINLAVALSEQSRVLLIDADLRKPKVHEYLGLRPIEGRGLGDLIFRPEDPLSKHTRTIENLTVLPGGTHIEHPLAILSSPTLNTLLTRAREEFDFIVIDSPPIMPVADGLILRGMSDYVALVVRAGYTAREVLRRALDTLDTSRLAGVILNDVDIRHSRYAYAYKYYQKSYSRRA